ncbi:DUF2490 domain-containing protein [candidate division KSB1 bacterium]|nr:DUF2490 domain-containing protein [candidate division KSB1 bacterium]MBL7094931.1 DUF2490 domain-containing protein [candidate division KSB1 bacterium]
MFLKIKTIFGITLILFIFNSILISQEDGDGQLWNTNRIGIKLSTNWKIELEEEFRFGSQASDMYYHHTDGYLAYKLIEWFEVGASYRQIFELKNENWQREDRPHLNGTFKWNWLGVKFKDRSRFEYRIRAGKDSVWRYRNKFTVPFPISWTKFHISPFLCDEIFYEFNKTEITRNRLYSGVALSLSEKINVKIFYLWQSSKKVDDWIDYNVFGLYLSFK